MKVYKVVITKTVFVEAEDKDEATDLALDGDCIMCDECIDSVKISSKNEMRLMMLSEW